MLFTKRRTRTLTSGEVAKLLDVSPRSVNKWVDAGKIHAHRLPGIGIGKKGAGDRRIFLADLLTFMDKRGIPRALLGDDTFLTVLCVSEELAALSLHMTESDGWRLAFASDGFTAGRQMGAHPPALAVVDLGLGRQTMLGLARSVQACGGETPTPLVLLACEDETAWPELWEMTPEVVQKPFDAVLLAERIRSLCEGGRP